MKKRGALHGKKIVFSISLSEEASQMLINFCKEKEILYTSWAAERIIREHNRMMVKVVKELAFFIAGYKFAMKNPQATMAELEDAKANFELVLSKQV